MKHAEWGAAVTQAGSTKARKTFLQLILLGFLGGLYISFGGHLFLAALNAGAGRIAASFLFSVGLVLVVLTGAELFTGNIILVAGLIEGRFPLGRMLRNWGLVYLGNLIGSVGYALLTWKSGLFGIAGDSNSLGILAAGIAAAKAAMPFGAALIRGILCNMLVVLAVILAIATRDVTAKIICCVLPVGAFVAMGFEHCIANMFLIPIGLLAGGASAGDWLAAVPPILVVTLGNIIGGIFILVVHPDRIRKMASR